MTQDLGLKEINKVVPLIEAIHFRRGTNNMKVWDMEIELPIPKKGDNDYDWDVVFQAWWIVILEVYRIKAKFNKAPLKTTLEMRIMGGSNIIMAP